ncbi:hypothetical protein Tco_1384435 [Tanacetum coccineum]
MTSLRDVEDQLKKHFISLMRCHIREALGGNIRTLDSIWEEMRQDCNSTRTHSRIRLQTVETTSKFIVTPSEHSRDNVNIHPDDVKVTDLRESHRRFTG